MNRREFMAGIGLLALVPTAFGMQELHNSLPDEGFQLRYKVSLGDTEIGHQEVVITKHTKDDHLVIKHSMDVKVRMLFAVVYSLQHESTEVWTVDKRLVSVDAETVENGEPRVVNGLHKDDGFHIEGEFGEHKGLNSAVTTDSFWLASAMEAPSIINVKTGELAKPAVTQLADGSREMSVEFPHGAVVARLKFDGDFLDYAEIDSDGHVVKFEKV